MGIHRKTKLTECIPGLFFCIIVGSIVFFGGRQKPDLPIDPLLISLLLGIILANTFVRARWLKPGLGITGKQVLEFAVMILGASVFLPDMLEVGHAIFLLIVAGVTGGMLLAYVIGHVLFGLTRPTAILIGVGNSICGNSAIAVAAPIVGATSAEIGAVIGISAILGAVQIIFLPLLASFLGLSDYQYGLVVGMAVYAVAQVYAASAPVSNASASLATVVKLTRVILLGPLVVAIQGISKVFAFSGSSQTISKADSLPSYFALITRYVPWFLLGFIVLTGLRSTNVIPQTIGEQIRQISQYLFVISMLAIGLSVDLRDILKIGPKVAATIFSILLFMIAVSLIGGRLILDH